MGEDDSTEVVAGGWMAVAALEAAELDVAAICMARKGEGVESQKRLCLLRLVTVLKACPHLWHLICIRQVACILLCLHRLENWV